MDINYVVSRNEIIRIRDKGWIKTRRRNEPGSIHSFHGQYYAGMCTELTRSCKRDTKTGNGKSFVACVC